MAISDISLTAGMRSNLLNLQSTTSLLDRTQTRLSTGKRVNTALDDPVNFFAAQSHTQRASDLAARKDGMSEAIQTIKAADNGIEAMTSLLQQAKAITTAARTTDYTSDEMDALEAQFDQILTQIKTIAVDSVYKGINLLGGDTLTVEFDEAGDNTLAIAGFTADTTDGVIGGATVNTVTGVWTGAADAAAAAAEITDTVGELDDAIAELRAQSKTLSSNLSIVTTRQDFTSNMINTLQTGADNLTAADMNEEGANMLMLQTRQQLGTTALSLSAQAAQAVLGLF